MTGLLISLSIQAIRGTVTLTAILLRLLIRGSVLLVAAIAGLIASRSGGQRAGLGFARRRMDPQLRWAVFQRDGYACVHCGSSFDLTVDHIHPVSLGGLDDPTNLQTLCRSCNSVKGA